MSRRNVNGFAQHGIGFVGQAVARVINDVCPHTSVIGVDVADEKVHELRDVYGIRACQPEDVAEYAWCDVHSFSIQTPASAKAYWGYDLSYLTTALEFFGGNVLSRRKRHTLVVIRSTVYPGTTGKILIPLLERASGKHCGVDFSVVYNPEFLAQETAYEDALHPPLVACATSDADGVEMFKKYLAGFSVPFEEFSSFEAAEGLKMANNVLNATVISFANEFRSVLRSLGVTAEEAERITLTLKQTAFAKTKPAYGLRDLGPYGGACLPKEVTAFITASRARGFSVDLVEAVNRVNVNRVNEITHAAQHRRVGQVAA